MFLSDCDFMEQYDLEEIEDLKEDDSRQECCTLCQHYVEKKCELGIKDKRTHSCEFCKDAEDDTLIRGYRIIKVNGSENNTSDKIRELNRSVRYGFSVLFG